MPCTQHAVTRGSMIQSKGGHAPGAEIAEVGIVANGAENGLGGATFRCLEVLAGWATATIARGRQYESELTISPPLTLPRARQVEPLTELLMKWTEPSP